MISEEASAGLVEIFRQITIFIVVLLGVMLVLSISLIVLGIYFLYKSKSAKEDRNKKIFKILAIICWILASIIVGYIIWLYIH